MGLDFNYGQIKDWENVCFHPGENGEMKVLTSSLIWATMAVGINKITEKNALDFYKRVNAFERIFDAYRTSAEGPVYFTLEEIRQHIGLYTNASPLTEAEFRKNLFLRHSQEIDYKQRRKEEQAA